MKTAYGAPHRHLAPSLLHFITSPLRHSARGMRVLVPALLVTMASAVAGHAAQRTAGGEGAYPDKPIRFIIPYPAGGATDVLSRMLGERLSAQLGQPVVADNRGGAAGRIGLELLVKSPPDGYTISLPSSGAAISATLIRNLPYDPLRDFAYVTLAAEIPNFVATPMSLPSTTLKEFIAFVKARPGAYNYGSGGVGATNHIAAELLLHVAGLKMSHVPYKSSAGGLTDVISGQVQMMLIGPPAAVPHIQAGRLRALAFAYDRRFPAAPEVPTTAEAGLPGVESPTWYGVVVPARTPKPIVERLNRELVSILSSPELKKQLLLLGAETRPGTPEEFAAFFKSEVARWAKVIRTAGVKAE